MPARASEDVRACGVAEGRRRPILNDTERSGGKAAHDRLRDFPDVRVRLVPAMGQGARRRLSGKTSSTDLGSAKSLSRRVSVAVSSWPLARASRP